MGEAPDPLVPIDADLRGLQFMPLDVVRLMDSDLFALSTGEEFKAAVAAWCKSWVQVPAGSLPDDNRVLAHLTGAGNRWNKVRVMALHGFVKCSDGRLYHPVVCEKVREAWAMRLRQRERSAKGNAIRWGSQENPHGDPHGDPHCDPHGDPHGDPQKDEQHHRKGQGQGQGEGERDASPSGDAVDNAPGEINSAKSEANGHERPNKRGTRLPADWRPGSAEWDFAVSLKLDPETVASEFRDYWCPLPGAKACKLDWPATFRNRCREIAGRTRSSGYGGRSSAQSGPITDAINAIRARRNLE